MRIIHGIEVWHTKVVHESACAYDERSEAPKNEYIGLPNTNAEYPVDDFGEEPSSG
jgi:hypothetical protein